jgi:general secretion pathway protein C
LFVPQFNPYHRVAAFYLGRVSLIASFNMISRADLLNFSSVDAGTVNRILPPVVSLLLVVLIAWQMSRMIWMLVPGSAIGDAVPLPDTLPESTSVQNSSTDVQFIADTHIFGTADVEDSGPLLIAQADEDLADTRLVNLTLNGTVASEIPNYSVAIISDDGEDQEVYIIGDSVGNNTTLHAVYADRVVLNEKGVLTNLKLPREFKDVPVSNRRRTTSTRQSSDNSQSIQAVVTQNLTKLTDVIRPTPYRVDGKQVGFRVYPGRDRRKFAALGLRPGDIIKDIDGKELTDASQAMQVFQSLGTSEQVTVTIERNGESESLTLKTSQLDLSGEQTK